MYMSYCMWQNTALSLNQLLASLRDSAEEGVSLKEYLHDRSSYEEQRAVSEVLKACAALLEEVEGMRETEEEN